jgi:hypothetical protein
MRRAQKSNSSFAMSRTGMRSAAEPVRRKTGTPRWTDPQVILFSRAGYLFPRTDAIVICGVDTGTTTMRRSILFQQ